LSGGLIVPEREKHDGKEFASYSLRQCIEVHPQHPGFSQMPYDFFAHPSIFKRFATGAARFAEQTLLHLQSCKGIIR